MDTNHILFWSIFAIVISIMLYIDLYVTDHRKGKIGIRNSLIWSAIWIATALIFNVLLYFFLEDGHTKAVQFFVAYIVEKSLSVDNLFVFLMIFSVMGVSDENQPHVLKWGILTAVILRVVFILAGVALIHYFHPIIYIFGILLFYASYKMAFGSDEKIDVESNKLIQYFKKHFNLLPNDTSRHFFIKKDKKTYITPLFLTLVLIESSDVMFAIDSIPAVLAISSDPFIAITSNIFAILGLRALYFALAGIVEMFTYLKYGVAIILAYVGVKMLISDFYQIPTIISLGVIVVILTISILLTYIIKKPAEAKND